MATTERNNGNLIENALQFMHQLGLQDQRHNEFKILGIKDENPRALHYTFSGAYGRLLLPPGPVNCFVEDHDSFVTAMTSLAKKDKQQVVFVGPNRIIGFLDYADRLDRINFQLSFAPEHTMIAKLAEDPTLTQRELLRILKNDLGYCYGNHCYQLLSAVRSLKWSQASSGQSVIRHGGESLGSSVELEVAGAEGEIPEEVQFETDVYKNFLVAETKTYVATCTVEVDVSSQCFHLRPLAGTVESHRRAANNVIVEYLQSKLPNATVLSGSPS